MVRLNVKMTKTNVHDHVQGVGFSCKFIPNILSFQSMGFCILVVCGLQRLASVGRQSASDLRGINHGELKTDFECPDNVVNSKLHKVVLFSVFVLIGLFCCKVVVRNRVWSSRETLFRYKNTSFINIILASNKLIIFRILIIVLL